MTVTQVLPSVKTLEVAPVERGSGGATSSSNDKTRRKMTSGGVTPSSPDRTRGSDSRPTPLGDVEVYTSGGPADLLSGATLPLLRRLSGHR